MSESSEILIVKSPLLSPRSDKPLTPAMLTALWVISNELDQRRMPAEGRDAVWLEIPAAKLRGPDGRNDNVWLRQCLSRLVGVKLDGEYKGNPWGAVILAEWQLVQGGTLARLLIPPAAVRALQAPETFTRIEAFAAYKLQGAAQRLYAVLADKRRMTSRQHWTFDLSELRVVLGTANKRAYDRWDNFRARVLDPALAAINDFGTVTVKMSVQKNGKAIAAVRFDWVWKTLDEARATDAENDRPAIARGKQAPPAPDAPPMIEAENEKAFFAELDARHIWVLQDRRNGGIKEMKAEHEEALREVAARHGVDLRKLVAPRPRAASPA